MSKVNLQTREFAFENLNLPSRPHTSHGTHKGTHTTSLSHTPSVFEKRRVGGRKGDKRPSTSNSTSVFFENHYTEDIFADEARSVPPLNTPRSSEASALPSARDDIFSSLQSPSNLPTSTSNAAYHVFNGKRVPKNVQLWTHKRDHDGDRSSLRSKSVSEEWSTESRQSRSLTNIEFVKVSECAPSSRRGVARKKFVSSLSDAQTRCVDSSFDTSPVKAKVLPRLESSFDAFDRTSPDERGFDSSESHLFQKWLDSYSHEQESFRSLSNYCEVKLTEILADSGSSSLVRDMVADETGDIASRHQPSTPSAFKTAVCCDLFDCMIQVFGRYKGVMQLLKNELFNAIYQNYTPVTTDRQGPPGNIQELMDRRPYFQLYQHMQDAWNSHDQRNKEMEAAMAELEQQHERQLAACTEQSTRNDYLQLDCMQMERRIKNLEKEISNTHSKYESERQEMLKDLSSVADLRQEVMWLQTEIENMVPKNTLSKAEKKSRYFRDALFSHWSRLEKNAEPGFQPSKNDISTLLSPDETVETVTVHGLLLRWVNYQLTLAGYPVVSNLGEDMKNPNTWAALLHQCAPSVLDDALMERFKDFEDAATALKMAELLNKFTYEGFGASAQQITGGQEELNECILAAVFMASPNLTSTLPAALEKAASFGDHLKKTHHLVYSYEHGEHPEDGEAMDTQNVDLTETIIKGVGNYEQNCHELDKALVYHQNSRRKMDTAWSKVRQSITAYYTWKLSEQWVRSAEMELKLGELVEQSNMMSANTKSKKKGKGTLATPQKMQQKSLGLLSADSAFSKSAMFSPTYASAPDVTQLVNWEESEQEKAFSRINFDTLQFVVTSTEDCDTCVSVLLETYGVLRAIFRYYCLTNASTVMADVPTMGEAELTSFCTDTRMFDKNFVIGELQEIVIAVCGPVKDKHVLTNAMFLEALVRIAAVKYKNNGKLVSEQLRTLLSKYVLDHGGREEVAKFHCDIKNSLPLQSVVMSHDLKLQAVFDLYQKPKKKEGKSALSVDQFISLLKDSSVVEGILTLPTVSSVVNFLQNENLAGPVGPATLDYSQFIDCLTVCASYYLPQPYFPLHQKLEKFLLKFILPLAPAMQAKPRGHKAAN